MYCFAPWLCAPTKGALFEPLSSLPQGFRGSFCCCLLQPSSLLVLDCGDSRAPIGDGRLVVVVGAVDERGGDELQPYFSIVLSASVSLVVPFNGNSFFLNRRLLLRKEPLSNMSKLLGSSVQ